MSNKSKALVILSGGQDSVTCLAWAVRNYGEVHAVTFDYGQRHRVEIECAKAACAACDVDSHVILDVTALGQVSTSALTNTTSDVNEKHRLNENLPASFVPNRNAMFLTLAHSYAQTLGVGTLITGVCQTDYSGYPDCRQEFIDEIAIALNTGADTNIDIVTPLMNLSKAKTWELAEECDAVELVVNTSHTCYNGDHLTAHAWGYGCGKCPACKIRKQGWEEYQVAKQ